MKRFKNYGKSNYKISNTVTPVNQLIAETGYWTFSDERFQNEHRWDSGISNSIVSLAKEYSAKKVYDFGCGAGEYVAHLNREGINAVGFDGNPITSTIPNCRVQDLTGNFQLEPVDFWYV